MYEYKINGFNDDINIVYAGPNICECNSNPIFIIKYLLKNEYKYKIISINLFDSNINEIKCDHFLNEYNIISIIPLNSRENKIIYITEESIILFDNKIINECKINNYIDDKLYNIYYLVSIIVQIF